MPPPIYPQALLATHPADSSRGFCSVIDARFQVAEVSTHIICRVGADDLRMRMFQPSASTGRLLVLFSEPYDPKHYKPQPDPEP